MDYEQWLIELDFHIKTETKHDKPPEEIYWYGLYSEEISPKEAAKYQIALDEIKKKA